MNFSKELAIEVGVEKAVLLSNIAYWIEKNKANDRHFYDGRYWTYNSAEAFTKLFPFWSARKIGRMLSTLEEDGYILSGNYNPVGYDRTKWYALNDKCIRHFCQMDSSNMSNRIDSSVEPIPNINTNKKPNKNTHRKKVEIPAFEEFASYASTLPIWHNDYLYSLNAKYNAWKENEWKDGNGNVIKNWKTKIQNTLPHLKRIKI